MQDIERDVALNFLAELENLLEKFDEMLMNATVIGILEVVKQRPVAESLYILDEEDDEEDD